MTAIVAGTVARKLEQTRAMNWKTMAFMAAGFVASFAGGFGLAASLGVDRIRSSEVAKDQKKILADHYRDQIAVQLGMRPQDVTYRDLDRAAQVNPAFAQLTSKVNLEKERSERAAIVGTAGGFALGGMLPGWSAVANVMSQGAAHTAGHVVGNIGGAIASGVFNKDKLETEDIVAHIDAKVQQSQPIEAMEVMLLRISQDEALQEQISKMPGGKPLHKMNETEQRGVLAAMPELYATAERDAQAVNSGRITQQDLLVTSPGQTQQAFGQFTARHQSRAAQGGDFRSRLAAQRAAAPAGQGRIV
jgi:hypothetical protein